MIAEYCIPPLDEAASIQIWLLIFHGPADLTSAEDSGVHGHGM